VKKFYVLGIRVFLVISLLSQGTFINAEELKLTFESDPYEEMILACIRPLGSIRTVMEKPRKLKKVILGNAAGVNEKTNTIEDVNCYGLTSVAVDYATPGVVMLVNSPLGNSTSSKLLNVKSPSIAIAFQFTFISSNSKLSSLENIPSS
jgi:hypothetical protein